MFVLVLTVSCPRILLNKDKVLSSLTRTLVIDSSLCPASMAARGDDILEPCCLVLHSMTRAPVTKMRPGSLALTANTHLGISPQYLGFHWLGTGFGALQHSEHHAIPEHNIIDSFTTQTRLTCHRSPPPWRSGGSAWGRTPRHPPCCTWLGGSWLTLDTSVVISAMTMRYWPLIAELSCFLCLPVCLSQSSPWHLRSWSRSGHETPPLLSGLITDLLLPDVPDPHEELHGVQEDQSDTSQSNTKKNL